MTANNTIEKVKCSK